MMSPVKHEQLPGGQSGIILKRTNDSPGSRFIRPMAARVQILSIPVGAGQNTKPARDMGTLPSCGTRIPALSRCYGDQTCSETRLFRNIPDMSQWQIRDQKNPPNSSHSEQDSTRTLLYCMSAALVCGVFDPGPKVQIHRTFSTPDPGQKSRLKSSRCCHPRYAAAKFVSDHGTACLVSLVSCCN